MNNSQIKKKSNKKTGVWNVRNSLGFGAYLGQLDQLEIRNSSNFGFTLIELLAVVSIMVVISTMSIANFRAAEKQKRVVLAADMITNAIRSAQNLTLTGKGILNNAAGLVSGPGNCLSKAVLDYYIVFNVASSYTIYAEDTCTPVSAYRIEDFTLPVNTSVNTVTINGINQNSIGIKFTAPFGIATAQANGGGFGVFASATVKVQLNNETISKVVNIDGVSGRIGQ